ncbi:hypothetical protein FC50_GL000938 [Lacticaseibacillus pantheris DSM 15945 = JCM 12539 = NBRC 106106]|uniref:Uncharacterized protein n=1 Tax=Lacticaseibacillus pantheris DSM 15945 = JCM 12539 = NBRC 106106 TaxID=1423783 RepID=A0A0R1TYV8_9LACO|nr:hypothetical protein [Lacticaseibacillus pantheris]KRL86416.1 hypothetical protein FC50_GL000938 [Lacticaseibacillus pantheris DSM 15945 = JCM 12539 = NBRC 106106]
MAELTQEEKDYNAWWMSRFDADHCKVIRLYNHHHKVQEYTTANARYSDMEDAECAYWVATQAHQTVTRVMVDDKTFKRINGRIQIIANM